MNIPLLTDRLRIDRLDAGNASAMYIYRSDPGVARYQYWEPSDVGEVESFIRNLESEEIGQPGTWYQLGIFLIENDELIGDLGIHVLHDDSKQAELGITLAPKYHGRGLAAEAVTALLGFLFDQLQMHRVFGSVDPRNSPSMALMQRVGMRKEAHLKESLWFKGSWVDDVIFAMLDREYEEVKKNGDRSITL